MQHKFLARPNNLKVIGAQFFKGGMRSGPEHAPEALMGAGLLQKLQNNLGFSASYEGIDYGVEQFSRDVDNRNGGMAQPRSVSAVTEDLSARISRNLKEGCGVLTLGGDHSIGLGTMTGVTQAAKQVFQKNKVGVIWVDAHGDINTPSASTSGHLHGMPLAWALGLAHSKDNDVFGWIKEDHLITPDKLVYIGIRDLDESEKQIIKEHDIKAFTMNDVVHMGIRAVMDQTLAHIGSDIPIHMSFDIDSLDPVHAPGTGLPVEGGLSLAEGNHIASRVHDTRQMVAMDLVEVDPGLDQDKRTIRAAISIIQHALGLKHL